jgi:nitrate reductase gamma subunit
MVLCGAPFAVTRPLFEGMRRGAPGLVVAIARYVLLSAPGALAGAAAARALGWQPVVGVASGLVAIAAVASGAFLLWARRALAEAERDAALRVDPGARA